MSIKRIVSFALGRRWLVLATLMLTVLMCEIYMHLPISGHQLEYEPDDQLVAVLRPNQVGYMWLGNMSFKSPLITINGDGHRGKETDWHRPVVLTVGNSENMGIGVEDSGVWSSVLESLLRKERSLESVQVVNASHPGHGPYHHLVRLKRVLEKRQVNVIIVRADLADRYFRPVPSEVMPVEIESAKMRALLRRYSKSVPYLFNKVEAQLTRIKRALKHRDFGPSQVFAQDDMRSAGERMWNDNLVWWKEMVQLAVERDIPIVFMVFNPLGRSGPDAIFEGLTMTSSSCQHCYVLRLGPEVFGLGQEHRERWREWFNENLTIGRDPHANGLQHRLIAIAIAHYLSQRDVLSVCSRSD